METLTYNIKPIGIVHNDASHKDFPGQIKAKISEIEIFPEYADGLYAISQHKSVSVIFGLNLIDDIHLREVSGTGITYGIFACRSQFRPNHLGLTLCRLISCQANRLNVEGLDACDGSPVFDIKCPDTSESEILFIQKEILQNNPRHDIEYLIRNQLFDSLCLKAGQMSGSLSFDLYLGVMSALDFMLRLRKGKKSLENFTLSGLFDNQIFYGKIFVNRILAASER